MLAFFCRHELIRVRKTEVSKDKTVAKTNISHGKEENAML